MFVMYAIPELLPLQAFLRVTNLYFGPGAEILVCTVASIGPVSPHSKSEFRVRALRTRTLSQEWLNIQRLGFSGSFSPEKLLYGI